MSTNYFARPACPAPCAHCDPEPLHIGKSALGWKFLLRGHPDHDPPLMSWAAWQAWLEESDTPIVDQYGRSVSLDQLVRTVTQRHAPRDLDAPICAVFPTGAEQIAGFGGRWQRQESMFHDPEGFDFQTREFS